MRVNVIKKHPDAFRFLHILPSAAVLGGLVLACLSWFNPLFSYLLLALVALYASGVIFGSVLTAHQRGWKYLPILPLVFFTLHASFGTGFIVGLFKSQKWGGAIPKWAERVLLFLSDYLAVNAAFWIWANLRSELGLFAATQFPIGFYISNIIFGFWFFIFLFFGMYRAWEAQSRVDEFIQVTKATFWGVLAIFLITFDIERDLPNPLPGSRLLLLTYWSLLAGLVGGGRFILHTFQRKLLELGIGMRRTLIVGWGEKAYELFEKVSRFPALGYRIIGFIAPFSVNGRSDYKGVPLMGALDQLSSVIHQNKVEEILIALDNHHQEKLYDVISGTDGLPVRLKIVPDLYSIITGQARTNQIYGFPLIEILPQLMPAWEKRVKRLIDIVISVWVLCLGLPLWLLVALLIKLDSPGTILYKQERVGLNGKLFNIYKFRSMVQDAEKMTGPKWAEKDDPRITRVGKWIRKLRIDEIPQFWNVLKGEMSLVGPRPERPYFVKKLKKELPLYARRLRVRPGITGWAQIKGAYDTSIEDVKQKLQYDLFYLENMSLRMDLKILLNTIYVMLTGKGQ
ncbi:MAG: sugar transferase [Calditrichaeota bacterium]|nr:MAG: sugar transferase [Calditrichota bacterium]